MGMSNTQTQGWFVCCKEDFDLAGWSVWLHTMHEIKLVLNGRGKRPKIVILSAWKHQVNRKLSVKILPCSPIEMSAKRVKDNDDQFYSLWGKIQLPISTKVPILHSITGNDSWRANMHLKPRSAEKREFVFSARKRQKTDFFMVEIRRRSLIHLAVSMLLETLHLSVSHRMDNLRDESMFLWVLSR